MRPSLRLALSFLMLAANSTPALAAWPNQPFVNLPVCTSSGAKSSLFAVQDGSGGMVVAWLDSRSGASQIYAQHVLAAGKLDPAWPATGRLLTPGLGLIAQTLQAFVPDGSGGAIAVWTDSRAASIDVYAQHVLATGALDPAWPATGRAVCNLTGAQQNSTAVSDGAGGVIIAWQDERNWALSGLDVYAHHVLSTGALDPVWPATGRLVCNAANNQIQLTGVADGAGGAIFCWADYRPGVNLDVYAHRVLAAGTTDPNWPVNGRAVCTATGNQGNLSATSDGGGGAIIAWEDFRTGGYADLYVQNVTLAGRVNTAWPNDGRAVCTAVNSQMSPRLIPDGAGGAIVSWEDLRNGSNFDIYSLRVLAAGIADPAWPADGRALCTAAGNQSQNVIAPDGAGGAIVAWADLRSNVAYDLYASRVLSTGALDSQWPVNGTPICTAPESQGSAVAVSNGAGGALFAWNDGRNYSEVYAQCVVKQGYLGTPGAEMAGVTDVPHDQGGAVRVAWAASYLEFEPYSSYVSYYLFRSVPTRALAPGAARIAGARAPDDPALAPGDVVSTSSAAGTIFWELVASFTGYQLGGYSEVTPTTADSVAGGNPRTLFMVQTRAGSFIANSLPDSGYSVDNLAPAAPTPLVAQYAGGTTRLHWNPNTEGDLAGYRLYRGSSPAFSPSPSSLVATPADTGWTDAANAPYVYKLTAVDSHGNESPVATVTPSGTTAVDGGPARAELALAPAAPNPAARSTTLRFTLPVAASLSLSVFDASGRLVRELASGERTAGTHAFDWDLRDGTGRGVGAGLYFARLECAGRTLVQRIAVTR